MHIPISRKFIVPILLWTTICLAPQAPAVEAEARLAELNAYWTEVSRAVRDGDFEAYKATCYEEGVLVSISRQSSVPLIQAVARWKSGIDASSRIQRFRDNVASTATATNRSAKGNINPPVILRISQHGSRHYRKGVT